MTYVLLAVTALFLTMQNILKEKYNAKVASGSCFFSALIAFFAMLFFMVLNRDWGYRTELLLPSVLFALSYAAATVCTLLAFKHGSLALTSLILSYSLLIPALYGLLFLGEDLTETLVIGVILLVLSLWLTNQKAEKSSVNATWKWLLFVLIAFLGNGMCSVVQKAEVTYYGDQNSEMFMIVALAIGTVMLMASSLALREKNLIDGALKKGWYLALLCGAMNGAVNFLVLGFNQSGVLPASVLYPVLSGASLVMILPYSIFICRERFTKTQYVGFALGLASVIFLNI